VLIDDILVTGQNFHSPPFHVKLDKPTTYGEGNSINVVHMLGFFKSPVWSISLWNDELNIFQLEAVDMNDLSKENRNCTILVHRNVRPRYHRDPPTISVEKWIDIPLDMETDRLMGTMLDLTLAISRKEFKACNKLYYFLLLSILGRH